MDKKKLSKTILQMKFMKRTKEKVELEEENEQGRLMYSGEITDKMIHGNTNFIIESSYVNCENLIDEGRFSYNGMNPEIERLMASEKEAKVIKTEPTQEADINDNDMAQHYSTILTTMKKKFEKKRSRNLLSNNEIGKRKMHSQNNKKMKFIRPNDDE